MVAKYFILKSIIKSQRIIGLEVVEGVKDTVEFPLMATRAEKSLDELRHLTIPQV